MSAFQGLLDTMHNIGGEVLRADLTSTYGVDAIKEAVHRGLIRYCKDSTTHMELTERGDRIRQGLPGEAAKQTEIEVPVSELVELYLKHRPGGAKLDFFTINRNKVIIFVEG